MQNALTHQNQNEKSPGPWLTAEEAVEIYAAHHEETPLCEFFGPGTEDCWLAFADLDFDGVLEAVANSRTGSAHESWMVAYRINRNTLKVEEVPLADGPKDGELESHQMGGETRLVRNQVTGEKNYLLSGTSYGHGYSLSNTVCAWMAGGVLQRCPLETILRVWDDNGEHEKYFWMGSVVEKNEHGRNVKAFWERHDELDVQIGPVVKEDLQLKGRLLREKMLAAYLQFSCGRIVKGRGAGK